MAILIIGTVMHAMLPSAAHQISLWLGIGWAVGMTFAFSVWHLHDDGRGMRRRHIFAVVMGALAMIMTLQGVQGIVLVAIGESTRATVVSERSVESNEFRYKLQDSSQRVIPGELAERFDRYNAGDLITVTIDPRGKLDPSDLNVGAAKGWAAVSGVLSLIAMVWCFLVGYTAPGSYKLRKSHFRFKR